MKVETREASAAAGPESLSGGSQITLERGEEEVPADALPHLKSRKPPSKSTARHARETRAREGKQMDVSRTMVERTWYVMHYAPDLGPLIASGDLTNWAAYKIARERRQARQPDDGGFGKLVQAAYEVMRFAEKWVDKYGKESWAEEPAGELASAFIALQAQLRKRQDGGKAPLNRGEQDEVVQVQATLERGEAEEHQP